VRYMADSIVLNFLDKARHCNSVEELSAVIQDVLDGIGFPLWAYQTQSEILLEEPQPILVHNFPKQWESYYMENDCSNIDPVITYGKKLHTPFQWSQITEGIELNKQEVEYQSIAAEHGMHDGLAIPLIGANGRISMLSLATETKDEKLSKLLVCYQDQIIALAFAFHSIAKDFIKDNNLVIDKPELTNREKECLLWIAKGKSSWDIGQILGISTRTVVFHVENAKKKFGVSSRYHLIVKAIYDGHIKI
jgi:DNA-binding CsgD family transcriptional regulator